MTDIVDFDEVIRKKRKSNLKILNDLQIEATNKLSSISSSEEEEINLTLNYLGWLDLHALKRMQDDEDIEFWRRLVNTIFEKNEEIRKEKFEDIHN